MSKLDPATQAKILHKYIADRKVLIVDSSQVSRMTISNIMMSMGAKADNLIKVGEFQEAKEEIEKNKPTIVISDYDLGKMCGLDLLQKHRLHLPDPKDSIFILVTGNTSQIAVARAVEEDIDNFIIKPFTANDFKGSIIRALLAKIRPSEYIQAVEKGRELIAQNRADEAIQVLQNAKGMDPRPALACYYLGQAHFTKKAFDAARENYEAGLSYNKIHYKCMHGLYEALMAGKQHTLAYEVIKRVSHYFPANPQNLTAVLRLAIITKSYEDVERYYQIFSSIELRNEETIKYICAALVICGKHYIQQKARARALELFSKAAATASGRTKILRDIITVLLEFGIHQKAQEFLGYFPNDQRSSPDYHAMSLLILEATEGSPMAIERGRELINSNVHDPVIYQIMIRASLNAQHKAAAEDLLRTAIQKWPEQKNLFEQVMQGKKIQTVLA